MSKLLFISFVSLMTTLPAFADGVDGIFMVVKGQVIVTPTASGQPAPAKIGSKVHEGDQITAGPDSRAKIVMADKNVFNLSPDSKIVIEKYRNDTTEKKVEIKVEAGKLRSSLEQKYDGEKAQFNIKTPAAVAGVRGTDFITSYDAKTHVSNILTFHGTVAVSAVSPAGKISAPVFVRAGQTSSIKTNHKPDVPKAMPKQLLQQLNHDTSAAASDSSRASSTAANSSSNSSSRSPASTSTAVNTPAATALPVTPPPMISSQDLGPDAAKTVVSTLAPAGATAGVGAAAPQVLPTTPSNPGFLQNLSGTASSTKLQVTITPH